MNPRARSGRSWRLLGVCFGGDAQIAPGGSVPPKQSTINAFTTGREAFETRLKETESFEARYLDLDPP
jgi:hypothetical protein